MLHAYTCPFLCPVVRARDINLDHFFLKNPPLSRRFQSRRVGESVAHVTIPSIHPVKVQLFKLRPRRILPPLQAFGIHPCLYGTMHENFLVPFSNRFWNTTGAAQVPPENNHAQMREIKQGYKRTLGKKTHTTSKSSMTGLPGPAYDGAEE